MCVCMFYLGLAFCEKVIFLSYFVSHFKWKVGKNIAQSRNHFKPWCKTKIQRKKEGKIRQKHNTWHILNFWIKNMCFSRCSRPLSTGATVERESLYVDSRHLKGKKKTSVKYTGEENLFTITNINWILHPDIPTETKNLVHYIINADVGKLL